MAEQPSVTFDGRISEIGTPCFLQITLLNRPYADSTAQRDRDDIACEVSVDTDAFKGQYSTDIYSHELAVMRAVFAALYERVGQQAEGFIDLLEHAFEMKLVLTTLGHLNLEIVAHACGGRGPDLRFSMEADQSDLPHWIKQLDDALAIFPTERPVVMADPLTYRGRGDL